MEGRSLFIASSNTLVWNSYTFSFLFITSCNCRDYFYSMDWLDCILTIEKEPENGSFSNP